MRDKRRKSTPLGGDVGLRHARRVLQALVPEPEHVETDLVHRPSGVLSDQVASRL
jgi:hypothetical protein